MTSIVDLLSFARELKAAGWVIDCRRNTRGKSGVWRGRWVRREGACIYLNRSGGDGTYEIRASWWYGMRILRPARSLGEVRALWLEIEADMARGGPEQAQPAEVAEFEGQLDLLELLAVSS